MQTPPKLRINIPGRHCRCGALRTSSDRRCEKCQARSGWYRHNCRRPRRTAASARRAGMRNDPHARGRRQRPEDI